MTVLIIGGGISGLSVAHYLSKKIPPATISLWEASERFGGWIRSDKNEHGILFEQAARTLRPTSENGINTLNLIEELQLSSDVRPIYSSNPAAKNRLIYVNGKLHTLPSSLLSLFKKNPPFSKPLITSFLQEYRMPQKKVKDEPIYDFIQRRFGSEVADYLINPLICGICAGNAKEVSVHFLAGKLFEYEQMYGSVTKGVILNLFKKRDKIKKSLLTERAKKERWNVYSFNNGLETLPKRLYELITLNGVNTQLNTRCHKIEFRKNETIVHNENESVKSRHLFSTLISDKLAPLIVDQHPKLSKLLETIESVDVAIVNLYFERNVIKSPGFGFLVPPQENLPILGVIYDSCCFEQGQGTTLTVMMGGHWFEKYFSDTNDIEQFYSIALNHVKTILNIADDPVSRKVTVLEKCIPQYTVGHKEIVKKITHYIKSMELPLSLCGMSYNGVGVNDCILSAKKSVGEFLSTQKL